MTGLPSEPHEELRRYLGQRIELGEERIFLSEPFVVNSEQGAGSGEQFAVSRAQGGSKRSGDEGDVKKPKTNNPFPPESSTPQPPGEAGTRRPHESAPTAQGEALKTAPGAAWREGAPEIPGPGIIIPTVDASLFENDPLAELTLDALGDVIRVCEKCGLCSTRNNAVPGEGNPQAKLMVVGEGPGATEDETGRPFVGRAGKLLDDILRAIGFEREDVFIANIVKCRPPSNRNPAPDEIRECVPFLHRQITLIQPSVILAVGGVAATTLLESRGSLGSLRNRVHEYQGVPLIATYHPAALLRNPEWKKPTWDDVRIARRIADGDR